MTSQAFLRRLDRGDEKRRFARKQLYVKPGLTAAGAHLTQPNRSLPIHGTAKQNQSLSWSTVTQSNAAIAFISSGYRSLQLAEMPPRTPWIRTTPYGERSERIFLAGTAGQERPTTSAAGRVEPLLSAFFCPGTARSSSYASSLAVPPQSPSHRKFSVVVALAVRSLR